jgi:ADP-ribose pyrophosphatase
MKERGEKMIRKTKLEEIKSYIEELKVISSTAPVLVEQSKFLKIAISTHMLANNQVITREEIVKRGNDAVIILPITTEGKILLVIQPRPFTKEGVTIELPAGYIDDGETGYDASLRELNEETGYIPDEGLIKIGEFYQDQGCSRSINEAYIAFGCEKVKKQSLDTDEYIKYIECTYEEVIELISAGYIKSCNTLLTIKMGESGILKYLNTIKGKMKKRGKINVK